MDFERLFSFSLLVLVLSFTERSSISKISVAFGGTLIWGEPWPIRQMSRNEELPLRSGRHHLKRLLPAFDHSPDRESGRPVVLGGTIELGAVEQHSTIIANNLFIELRLLSLALLENLVLQAARQGDHAFLSFVLGEKFLAFLQRRPGFLFPQLGLLLAVIFLLGQEWRAFRLRSSSFWRR